VPQERPRGFRKIKREGKRCANRKGNNWSRVNLEKRKWKQRKGRRKKGAAAECPVGDTPRTVHGFEHFFGKMEKKQKSPRPKKDKKKFGFRKKEGRKEKKMQPKGLTSI